MPSDTSPPEPLTCTVKVAAEMLGLSNFQVVGLIESGHLEGGYTPKGIRLVTMASLREFVDNLPTTRPSKGNAA